MLEIRKSKDRGFADRGWLQSWHTFSFADYLDPQHMNFRVLRVINEDIVQPSQGFGTHGHRNMEIITYVISGELEHKDSMGNGSIIQAGDVQYMSAGSGVTHSEFNASAKEPVHLYQMWLLPNANDLEPRYAQIHVEDSEKRASWKLLVGNEGSGASISIRQDAKLWCRIFKKDETAELSLSEKRFAWIQVVGGELRVNQRNIFAGDGVSVQNEKMEFLCKSESAEVLVYDLP
jgi:redox-sensitive bicupin YhaK (pirin superfamily)